MSPYFNSKCLLRSSRGSKFSHKINTFCNDTCNMLQTADFVANCERFLVVQILRLLTNWMRTYKHHVFVI